MAEGLKDKYDEYMDGRNGGDLISLICLIVGLVLMILSFFVVANPVLHFIFVLLGIAAAAYAVFRMISFDADARQAEVAALTGIFANLRNRGGEGASVERPRRERPSRRERSYDIEDEQPQLDDEPEPEPEPVAQPEKVMVTCDSCGQQLRVPAGKGNIKVRCPKCSNIFQLFT